MATSTLITSEPELAPSMNPALDQLAFIVAGEWKPTRTGDYATDCNAGRQAAQTLIEVIEQTDNPLFFGTVMRAIVAAGTFDGVEAGFCSVIGQRL